MDFRTIFFVMGLAALLFQGCSTDPDDDSDPDNNPGTSSSGPDTLRGDITSDLVLKNKFSDSGKVDYRLVANINISAKVTVEPGVLIEVDAGRGISVNAGGSFYAVGLDTSLIIIRGKENSKGYWKGIEFKSNSNSNVLTHVVVMNGGSAGFTGQGYKANISIATGGRLKMTNSLSSHSGDLGLLLWGADAVLVDFSTNTIRENTGAPASMRLRHFAYLDTATSYSGNGKDYIENFNVSSFEDIDGVHSIAGIGVPYELKGSPNSIKGQMTILPGARFQATQDAGLTVAAGGFLKAVGTAEKPIEFSGKEDIAGYWRGIKVSSNSPSNELTHVVLTHGGSKSFDGNADKRANLFVADGGSVKITHSKVDKSGKHGLWAYNNDCSLEGFASNSFTGNQGAGVHVMLQHFSFLDTASDYSGNVQDYIGDAYLGFQREVTGDHVWKSLNVPYRLVGTNTEIKGNITVLPGARFQAEQGAGLIVASGGSLKAVGNAADSIYFRGAEAGAGIWRGLRFESNSPNNELAFIAISGGGSHGFDGANRKANIELKADARLAISNSTVSLSAGLGIRDLGGTLTQTDVVFSGNVLGNLVPAP